MFFGDFVLVAFFWLGGGLFSLPFSFCFFGFAFWFLFVYYLYTLRLPWGTFLVLIYLSFDPKKIKNHKGSFIFCNNSRLISTPIRC